MHPCISSCRTTATSRVGAGRRCSCTSRGIAERHVASGAQRIRRQSASMPASADGITSARSVASSAVASGGARRSLHRRERKRPEVAVAEVGVAGGVDARAPPLSSIGTERRPPLAT
eukprot:scaffold38990_cov26-Tisochrysis_lutea.AAC.1